MLHTARIEDSLRNGKKTSNDLQRQSKTAGFENHAPAVAPPEGYMTVEDFRKEAVAMVKQICNDNGIY